MIKLVFYLAIVAPAVIYFYVLSHSAARKWWQDAIAILVVVLVYLLFILNFYADDRIGNLTLIVSTFLLILFSYKGLKNALHKIKSNR